ncbi:MAG: cyanate hydratase, partial [Oceanospirillales bacterium]|nr:cyanate hydratase [Oceanospirillales bacterium]
MIQSHNSKNARQALTDQILAIKGEKDLAFAQLTEGTG